MPLSFSLRLIFLCAFGCISLIFWWAYHIPKANADITVFFLSGQVSPPVANPPPWISGGNAWSIWFLMTSDLDLLPQVDPVTLDLRWVFWSENAGWITFDHDRGNAHIDCPSGVLSGGVTCPVTGYAWSPNAGWIHLGGDSALDSLSRVTYDPDTTGLTGFWYSPNLWWIPLEGITVSSVPLGFQWRVRVIGNIAGRTLLDTNYNDIQTPFDTLSLMSFLADLRKQISYMGRGYSASNTTIDYRIKTDGDYIVPSTGWEDDSVRSYIVIGYDIIIKWSILENPEYPLSLIAIKSANGEWGNIYIERDIGGPSSPDRIYASLVAEGSIISGTKDLLWNPEHYIDISYLNIPTRQLYIRGIMISRNTIGGAARNPAVCPELIWQECLPDIAEKYDFNYFRNFFPGDASYNTTHRAYTKAPYLDTYSMVIEYDSRILSNPPPGLDFYDIINEKRL